MARPNDVKEQMAKDIFRPDRMITVLFAEDTFDKIGTMKEGNWKQYYGNLEATLGDLYTIQGVLHKYRISKDDKEFVLSDHPSE